MVRRREMQELVDNHVVTKFTVYPDEFLVEGERSSGGARRPLASHRTDVDRGRSHVQFGSPFEDTSLEFFFVAPVLHGWKDLCRRLNKASTVAVTLSMSSSSAKRAKVTFFRASRSSCSLRCQLGNSANAVAIFLLTASGFGMSSSVSLQRTK